MKWLAIFLFTVICRPGVIHEVDGTSVNLVGTDTTYYYYDLEYTTGAYLYVSSNKRDSVWFYVEDGFYYLNPLKNNDEFEVQK